MPITPRAFGDRDRRRAMALGIDPARLSPGQSSTVKWPVLSIEETPRLALVDWTLTVDGFWERNVHHHRGDPWREERRGVDDYVARALRREARTRGISGPRR